MERPAQLVHVNLGAAIHQLAGNLLRARAPFEWLDEVARLCEIPSSCALGEEIIAEHRLPRRERTHPQIQQDFLRPGPIVVVGRCGATSSCAAMRRLCRRALNPSSCAQSNSFGRRKMD